MKIKRYLAIAGTVGAETRRLRPGHRNVAAVGQSRQGPTRGKLCRRPVLAKAASGAGRQRRRGAYLGTRARSPAAASTSMTTSIPSTVVGRSAQLSDGVLARQRVGGDQRAGRHRFGDPVSAGCRVRSATATPSPDGAIPSLIPDQGVDYGYAAYMPHGAHGCFVDYQGIHLGRRQRRRDRPEVQPASRQRPGRCRDLCDADRH